MSTDMPPPSLVLPRRTGGLRRAAGDAGVQKTNDDAQSTKISCAQLGYFKDDLLPLLAKCLPSRKSPLINRGTWARHAAMRQAMTDFVTACVQHTEDQKQQHQWQGCSSAQSSDGNVLPTASTLHSNQQSEQQLQQQQHGAKSQPVCQVVVVGAGSDSNWFVLQQQGWQLLSAVRYIEVDYQEVVSKKARTILATDRLLQLLPPGTTATTTPPPTVAAAACNQHATAAQHCTWTKQASVATTGQLLQQQQQQHHHHHHGHHHDQQQSGTPPAVVSSHGQELYSQQYSLVAADIRNSQLFETALQRAGFDARLPTLYISECVLIYLEPSEAQQLLAAAAARTRAAGSKAAVVIYEQTRPDDAFGATMITNLEARGCPLRSVTAVPTPTSQQQRLIDAGWDQAAAADMAAVYYSRTGNSNSSSSSACDGWLRPEWQRDRMRVERLELLDELEEWKLLQEHYVVVLGVVGDEEGWLTEGLRLKQLSSLGGNCS